MTFLTELWLPILVSAVLVFIVSSVIHMVLPVHKGDVRKMPGEEAVLDAMRAAGVVPGQYMFPCADSMKEMCSPEMVAKMKQGPVGYVTVRPAGGFNMGRSLTLWFLLCLVISIFTAYVTWHALGAGASFAPVFRIAGVAAILAYAAGAFQDSIWKGVRFGTTLKFVVDGIVYGLVTAATFGWMWPAGTPALPGM